MGTSAAAHRNEGHRAATGGQRAREKTHGREIDTRLAKQGARAAPREGKRRPSTRLESEDRRERVETVERSTGAGERPNSARVDPKAMAAQGPEWCECGAGNERVQRTESMRPEGRSTGHHRATAAKLPRPTCRVWSKETAFPRPGDQ